MVRAEQLGWRDERVSTRHKMYGDDLPATDLDFPLLEYDHARPVALIELKYAAARVDLERPSIRALAHLADASGVPCVVALYDVDDWTYTVYPANAKARETFRLRQVLTEIEWVRWLYELRGKTVPPDIEAGLNGTPTWWG